MPALPPHLYDAHRGRAEKRPYLYVAADTRIPLVKIGHSGNPAMRCATLTYERGWGTAVPFCPKVVKEWWLGRHAFRFEQEMHEALYGTEGCQSGEWYAFPAEALVAMIDECLGEIPLFDPTLLGDDDDTDAVIEAIDEALAPCVDHAITALPDAIGRLPAPLLPRPKQPEWPTEIKGIFDDILSATNRLFNDAK